MWSTRRTTAVMLHDVEENECQCAVVVRIRTRVDQCQGTEKIMKFVQNGLCLADLVLSLLLMLSLAGLSTGQIKNVILVLRGWLSAHYTSRKT